jgi:glycerol-3-phosphate acyltransferase PlsY
MDATLFAILSYLYGSIPFGYIATYIIKGKRLTEEGTGNVGVTNTYKVGGTGAGIVTIIGEISKALVPIVTAKTLFPVCFLLTGWHQFFCLSQRQGGQRQHHRFLEHILSIALRMLYFAWHLDHPCASCPQ